jgi:uncharacterized membrane protein
VTVAVVTIIVAVALLTVLFCIYWALKCWEARRIIAHFQREERAKKVEQQRREGAKPNGGNE